MKKFISILFFAVIAIYSFAQSYEVRGAGTVEANGVYVASGTINNRQCYKKGEYTLFYKGCVSKWMITSSTGNLYRNGKDMEFPPYNGWAKGCDPKSKEPAPVIIPVNISNKQPKGFDHEKTIIIQSAFPVIRNVFSFY